MRIATVTENFFEVLGVRAAFGRTFSKGEDPAGPALVSHGFFNRRYGGSTEALGRDLRLLGWTPRLVGVLPDDFWLHFAPDANIPADVQVFVPFNYDVYTWSPSIHYLRTVTRLKPGVSLTAAQRDLDRVAAEIRAEYPEFAAASFRLTLTSMQVDAFRDIQPALAALFGGAALVLLICCLNITSLFLARATDRRSEIALRLALGASRNRILGQLMVEALVLCLLGGALGAAVGWVGFQGLLAAGPDRLTGVLPESPGRIIWPIVVFASAASLTAAALVGMPPAFRGLATNPASALDSGRRWFGRPHRRLGRVLVIVEIALGFVLVTGAALTARTLARIDAVRPGFEARRLLTFQLSFGWRLNPDIPLNSVSAWEADLAALPGVERVGATTHLPLDDFPNWSWRYRPERASAVEDSTLVADHRSVTPGYLAAMGVRLLEGRYFDQRDRADARSVVVVDELLARSAWPGQSAIGRKLEMGHVRNGELVTGSSEVVGVVEHVRNHSLTSEGRAQVYVPWEQSTRSPLTFVVRSGADPMSLVPTIRKVLQQSAPHLAMAKVAPMTVYVARQREPARFTAMLATIFGNLALLLAATGIYGVLNYQVSRRLPELGIRMALGATRRDVIRLVGGESLILVVAGMAIGLGTMWAVAQWLSTLLYGVSAYDPVSYAVALLLLPAAGLFGCWFPAWRAATVSPALTTREG